MPTEHAFSFPLPNGLHARPASHLQAAASRFAASCTLHNDRTGASANGKSVLSLVGADVRHGDPCRLRFDGPDERAAAASLAAFVRDVLPTVDEPAEPPPADVAGAPLPRSLLAAGLDRPIRGTPVSPGIGTGTVVRVGAWTVPPERLARPAGALAAERAAFARARQALHDALSAKVAAAINKQEVAVLSAHLAIADDVALADRVDADLAAGRSAVQAVSAAVDHYAATLGASTSEYLRERSLDVRDVGGQLLQVLCGSTDAVARAVLLDKPSVVVAESLTPGQFLGLDRGHLRGLVMAHGGTTSHTVILARSMGIPTVVGVADADRVVPPGRAATVDADLGLVVVDPPEPVRRYYRAELDKQEKIRERCAAHRDRPGMTADGRAIEVAANVASAEEVEPAVGNGAQGIGLFRTEMLFMDRPSAPSEDEQADIYARAAAAAAGRPVIIRLLDAGGDKPVPYLNLPVEANPFLGYRAVRFYADFQPLILSQLRAVLRATASGDVRVMVPMVCCVEEVRAVRALVAEAAESLAAEGRPVVQLPPLGIMVEVPSVALIVDALCDEVDFFSIGSNDLTQYLLAADRDNARVARLYGWSHPAVLRALKLIVDGAHARGKWVGLCGELADVPAALPALVGLGLDELSVGGARVPAVKQALAGLRYDRCRAALDAACAAAVRADVESAITAAASPSGAADLPLLSADLIHLAVDAATKAEAIKAVTDALAVAGRTADERAVEAAVWAREETYSTGFGYGLAVPHCKTESVAASSVVVARLNRPVDWGSLDGNPVHVVILLAIRAAGNDAAKEHMRVFAKLSRLVMRDEFRERLKTEADPGQLLSFLRDSLDLPRPA